MPDDDKHVIYVWLDALTNYLSALNFLNLEWSDNVREFHKTAKQRGIISTPSYNQVNMPLYKNSINRWKNYEKKFLDSKK